MRKDRPLLSLCLIARNEEDNLPGCLSAAAGLADEIVVADTGSTDRTREVAQAAGARVVDFPWCNDFAAARNACLSAASGAWILFVDADETLVPADGKRIRRMLETSDVPAYTVEVVSPLGGGRSDVSHLTRLFRHRPEFRYEGRIHEQILTSIARFLGVEVWSPPRSGLRLEHAGYLPEVRAARGKVERNRVLLKAAIEEDPEDPGWRFFFARESVSQAGGDLIDTDWGREGLLVLTPAANMMAELPPRGITDPVLFLAARLALAEGDLDAAARWRKALLDRLGATARWCYAEGEALLTAAARGKADPHQAVELFERVRRAPEGSDAIPAETTLRGEWSAVRELAARYLAGEPPGSTEENGKEGPSLESILIGAWSVARHRGPAAAIPLLGLAVKHEPQDPRGWWALGLVLDRLGQSGQAQRMYDTALRAAPGSHPPELPFSGLLSLWL